MDPTSVPSRPITFAHPSRSPLRCPVVPITMPQCAMCGEPGLLFVHVFIARKKRKSYPVCIRHAAWAYALQEIGQDWGRTNLARAFGIKKGTIPRIKVDLTP